MDYLKQTANFRGCKQLIIEDDGENSKRLFIYLIMDVIRHGSRRRR